MTVYRIKGDGEFFIARLPEELSQGLGTDFLAEYNDASPNSRRQKAQEWSEIPLQLYKGFTTDKTGQSTLFLDAINACNVVQGAEIIVSNSAKNKIEDYVKGECIFLPVNLLGAPQKYWLLYVTNILDCLVIKDSKLHKNRYSPKSVRHYSFDEKKLENTYLFRLPGHLGYLEDKDFSTSCFLNLVKNEEIRGFEFWFCNKPEDDPIVS